jgi:hypothetical protein
MPRSPLSVVHEMVGIVAGVATIAYVLAYFLG